MTDYVELDDEALQDLLANASSYDERSAIRQEVRRRKKERGQAVSKGDARGRSFYNRFAGSTGKTPNVAAKSFELPKTARSQQSTPALKPVKKDQPPAKKYKSPSPPPAQVSPEPAPESPPKSPEEKPVAPEQEAEPEETDGTPVTEEPAEDEPTYEEEEQDGGEEQEEEEEEEPQTEEPVSQTTDDVQEETEEPSPAPQEDSVEVEDVDASEGPKDLQHYLVLYVNKELALDPPLPSRGKALYDTCSDAAVLCKLINKSVGGTVDVRALSKVRGTAAQRMEAIEDNMTLVVESGRAIGCPIQDDTAQKIIQKDPTTITNFLVDLVRARVVHLPGMEDEPSSTFSDWTYLFEKLNISVSSEGSSSAVQKKDQSQRPSWRESSDSSTLTYEQRAAKRKAEREQRQREKDADGSSVGLTYEERAQQRKAERERRRREREALAK